MSLDSTDSSTSSLPSFSFCSENMAGLPGQKSAPRGSGWKQPQKNDACRTTRRRAGSDNFGLNRDRLTYSCAWLKASNSMIAGFFALKTIPLVLSAGRRRQRPQPPPEGPLRSRGGRGGILVVLRMHRFPRLSPWFEVAARASASARKHFGRQPGEVFPRHECSSFQMGRPGAIQSAGVLLAMAPQGVLYPQPVPSSALPWLA